MFNHELLVEYASGNHDPNLRSVVERHLATCLQCRREVVELEQTWWALDTWNLESQPAEPRLNDLQLRIAALDEPPPTLWKRAYHFAAHQWDAFKPAPRYAVAAALGVALMLPALHMLPPYHGGQAPHQAVAVEQTELPVNASGLAAARTQESGERAQQAAESGMRAIASNASSTRMSVSPVARGGLAPSADFILNRDADRITPTMASVTRVGYEPAW